MTNSRADIIFRAAWSLIWLAIGELPRDAALFHLRAAVKMLEREPR